MKINKLELKNFRLYDEKIIACNNKVNYFTGLNGTGKTSILEAIYLALTTKSFRTNDYRMVIKSGSEFAQINISFDDEQSLKFILTEKAKSIYLNDELVKKIAEYISLYPAISFSKKDYDNFFINPSFRRNYFDFEISKISPTYLNTLIEYNKILKKRNELLKDYLDENLDLIKTLTTYLIEKAEFIISERNDYISKLNNLISEKFKLWGFPIIQIKYHNNIEIQDLEIKLNDINRDIKYKQTMYGPQKDDYEILFNNFNILTYQSSGEQKISLFGIKLVIADLIKVISAKEPIILIDDIFSELDEENVAKIKKIIDTLDNQVFITTIINLNE